MTGEMVISATVVTDDATKAARAAEVLARAAAGLVLDGIDVSVSMGIPSDDDTGSEE
ncbi:MAG TPA: hypothetical protein VFR23_17880 [Jiangellaceae bacterium]|nr:hypothetical protein [Jiangellaceae bacterium]